MSLSYTYFVSFLMTIFVSANSIACDNYTSKNDIPEFSITGSKYKNTSGDGKNE